jgi:hypothetical protein
MEAQPQVVFFQGNTVEVALAALAASIPADWDFVTKAFENYLAGMTKRGEPLGPIFDYMDDLKILVDFIWNRPNSWVDLRIAVMISQVIHQVPIAKERAQ